MLLSTKLTALTIIIVSGFIWVHYLWLEMKKFLEASDPNNKYLGEDKNG